LIAEADQSLEEHERWRAEREEMPHGTVWRAPDPPIPHPVRRLPRAPRNWEAEAEWVRALCDQRIVRLKAEIAEGVGEALGRMREQIRGEMKATGWAAELAATATAM